MRFIDKKQKMDYLIQLIEKEVLDHFQRLVIDYAYANAHYFDIGRNLENQDI